MFDFKKNRIEKKYILGFVIVLILLLWIYSLKPIVDYIKKRQIVDIIDILQNDSEKTKDECSKILNFDSGKIWENNQFFNHIIFDNLKNQCSKKYDISKINIDKESCKKIIKETDLYFKNNYIILDSLEKLRADCSKKYLNPIFSTWSFFNVNNNFKSSIEIDFKLDFFTDIWEENSDEFIKNRIEAKKRLLKLIDIKPKVKLSIDDIYLYKNKAILNYNLDSLTQYKINLLSFKTDIWEDTKNKDFIFTTPENKYFWMKVLNQVSLYTKNNLPKFEILDFNTDKENAKIKICKISEDSYAKIEVFNNSEYEDKTNEFFKSWMKWVDSLECIEKVIEIKEKENINKSKLIKKEFSFNELIDTDNINGLYYVSFVSENDIDFNSRINKPIFFWIVNSHIMMKISKSWEAFFFVNDFEGNPLWNQKISVYLNDYKEIEKAYNRDTRKMDETYISPLKNGVFSKEIVLWNTNDLWILKVDLKEKVDNYFLRTFEDRWQYDYSWLYKSFFVKSSSNKYVGYLTSTWNTWISPWNFGYTTNYNYYWSNNDSLWLRKWWSIKEYFSHIYTDRVLYLPWEEVNIKWIIRQWDDLKIPTDWEFVLKVTDSNRKEILNEKLEISKYWSFSKSIKIWKEFPLWNYNISLLEGDNSLYNSWFSVEIFKNPKFKNEILLETEWLSWDYVNITETFLEKKYYYDTEVYKWKFKIKWKVLSKYYNWSIVKNTNFKYKVYKQYYYENSYWDNCYYGCYWEPKKQFYTEWKWKIDENWMWAFEIDVDFSSSYSDYKYIVEVTVTDEAWDTITGSNSIITKLPSEFKKYNSDLDINFKTDTKFVKVWERIEIKWWLNVWKWTKQYNDKYIFIIKRKEYLNKKVVDVNWYSRNIQTVNEILEKVLFINDKNFNVNSEWKLELKYNLNKNSEYIFEYGAVNISEIKRFLWLEWDKKIDNNQLVEILEDFNKNKNIYLENKIEITENNKTKNEIEVIKKEITKKIYIKDLISDDKYFSIITYDKTNALNPIENDNKLRVIPEKISYSLWETAKVLIRLPVSDSKILWTIEKSWIVESEYIDVKWNVFFKEFKVDDTFVPNAYIWVMMVYTDSTKVGEYKVWYSEIVVDKTDKKSFIEITADKKTYKPWDEVTLDLKVKDKKLNNIASELTVMVVDDSLISLMWNVDLNTLEKIYLKLPFSIQTSISNIAMLRNYYFSRRWIVGWSWFGNFKWWDSAVSTRNIFKNTAYFNPSVITDLFWKAKVKFTLPDNLTNFRIMVVSNSKDNFFGYAEDFLEVRKNVIVEDKTPLILRDWDNSRIWANIFNNTKKDIDFKVILDTPWIEVTKPEKKITIASGENEFVSWQIKTNNIVNEINYNISVLGDSIENSDKLKNKIVLKESPVLISNIIKTGIIKSDSLLDLDIIIPENTDLEKSKVELIFSNNKLSGIEKIVKSLWVYPYWCIEQTISSTLPNVILKEFDDLFSWIIENDEIEKNINYWIERIISMQTKDWWFAYWPWDNKSNLHITPYVVRSLIYMDKQWVKIPENMIDNAVKYLENNYNDWLSDIEKAEIYWALATAWKNISIKFDLQKIDRHTLIAYTYWLLLNNKLKNNQYITQNIDLIKSKIEDTKYSNRYWNTLSDKAIFASLLLETKYSQDYIETIIWDLYNHDWSSYYYSTQSKNNAFMAFSKYLNKTWSDNLWKFWFKIWNFTENKLYNLWWKNKNFKKNEYILSDILEWENLNFKWINKWDSKVFVDFIVKQYPLDKTKIDSYSNGMHITREIYKVNNENLLDKCSYNSYWYRKNVKVDCNNVLTKITKNTFEKWKLYKAKIIVNFDEEKSRRNLTIEDYLPWTFRVINSKFKTESSAVTWSIKNWTWNHKEYKPDVVMANTSHIWWKTAVLEYYFRPEFEWIYIYPPSTWYMMYNPLIRANTQYSIIEVK